MKQQGAGRQVGFEEQGGQSEQQILVRLWRED